MKRISIFFFVTLFAVKAWAVVAKPFITKGIQPDQTELDVKLYGDEHFHCYATIDGILLVESEKVYYYADFVDGKLMPSRFMAHNPDVRTSEEKDFIEANHHRIWETAINAHRDGQRLSNSRRTQRAITRQVGRPSIFKGQRKGLVILVSFTNMEISDDDARLLRRMFNEKGFHDDGHIGSVRDYFYDQSYSQFDLMFDVVGPVKMDQTFGYYGSNNSKGNDRYPGRMVVSACQLVDDQVDFSDYDWDGDGEVDQVFIIYAGYGEATGGVPSTIWPHESTLTNRSGTGDVTGPIQYDGVKIDTYACSNELDGSTGHSLMGIGTACHEFSHCLGLPDLYDIGYHGGFGMNAWDVMDAGSYSGASGKGEIPYGYSAYERWFAGWLEFKEVSYTQNINDIPCLLSSPEAYIVYNDAHQDELFIFENHQAEGWYQYLRSDMAPHGLMITHVDYDEDAWCRNRVNIDTRHQRMSIIPADKDYGQPHTLGEQISYYSTIEDLVGDLFPGKWNKTEMTQASHETVGGIFFHDRGASGNTLNFAVTDIRENDGLITLGVVFNNDIPQPVIQEAGHNQNSFKLTWKPVPHADYYVLELTTFISEMPYITETQYMDDIHTAEYVCKDLKYTSYKCRVRGVVDGVSSVWSEEILINLLYNSIAGINDNRVAPGYYTLEGVKTSNYDRLKKGVYILKEKSGSRKIVKR